MRVSELLVSIANWLESPDNEAVLLSEHDEDCLAKTAEGCVSAASILRKTAEEVEAIEPKEESMLTPENLEDLSQIALAFDLSDDPELVKQAKVIDELLLSIAAPVDAVQKIKDANNKKIDELTQKYKEVKESLHDQISVKEATKDIQESNIYKTYERLEHPLSARTCSDHAGALLVHRADSIWQCSIDNKIYDFRNGFKKQDGSEVPGGTVEGSHPEQNESGVFTTREEVNG